MKNLKDLGDLPDVRELLQPSRGKRKKKADAEMVEMIDAQELAKRLGVRRAHIYRLTELGKLPAYRVGRYLRYPWPEILRHLTDSPAPMGKKGKKDYGPWWTWPSYEL